MRTIGVDTGGTFTDVVVVSDDGEVAVGKAFSTPPDFEQGVLDSVGAAAGSLGLTTAELLAQTDVIARGTTVGLNGLLTGTGARVGLLVTAGFEATLPLAKANKLYGLPPEDVSNSLKWDKPPLLVPRRRIVGVRERIDVRGEVVVPLDEAGARRAIEQLGEQGVEAVGISLLWSTVQPAHERRLGELVREILPGVDVTLSSELAPRLGEYERTSSVVVNASVGPLVGGYLTRLRGRLAAAGFAGELLVMTMGGGVIPPDVAARASIHTLQSGPAGGLARARRVAARLGHDNVVTTDVGGTSFDVGLVLRGELPFAHRPMIERQALAVPVVDVASIGTGGGSIAWFDAELGTLRVGPASAGSRPGPACYGRGGEHPTLTDAAVVLGYVDRLGGSLELDRDAAATALARHVAEPMGVDLIAAARGVFDVATAQMADLVRRTTVRRGHDPAEFALYAFGGAAGQYVGRYAADIGAAVVVVPHLAAAFSAAGAATSDVRVRHERELAPRLLADAGEVDAVLDELAGRARAEAGGDARVERRIGLRYYRQIHAIEVAVERVDAAGRAAAASEFQKRYDDIVGAGTSASGAPIELVSVAAIAVRPMAARDERPLTPGTGLAPTGSRRAWFDGAEHDTPVHDWERLGAGAVVTGPAFVESPQTTVVVHPGQRASMDAGGNLTLTTAAPG